MAGIMGASRSYSVHDFLMMFIAPRWQNSTMGYLWFIGTMFFMFIIIASLSKLNISLRNTKVAVAIIGLLWSVHYFLSGEEMWFRVFNLQALTWYIPFFILGIHYHMNEGKLTRLTEGNWIKTLLLFLLTIVGSWLLMQDYTFIYLLKLVLAIIGVWFSMVLCNTLLDSEFVNKKVLPFGDITYTIYLMSFFGQYTAKAIIVNVMHLQWGFCVIGMFIGGMIFPLIVYKIYIKTNQFGGNNFLRILIGA